MNDSEERNDNIKDFLIKYRGAILGGIIALVLVCTGLFKVLLALIIITLRNCCGKLCTKK